MKEIISWKFVLKKTDMFMDVVHVGLLATFHKL